MKATSLLFSFYFVLLLCSGCATEPSWRYSGELHSKSVQAIEKIAIDMDMGKFGSILYEPQFEKLLTESLTNRFEQHSTDVLKKNNNDSVHILFIKFQGGTRITDRDINKATFLVKLKSSKKTPLYSMRIEIEANSPGLKWVWDKITAESMTDAIFRGLIGARYVKAPINEK